MEQTSHAVLQVKAIRLKIIFAFALLIGALAFLVFINQGYQSITKPTIQGKVLDTPSAVASFSLLNHNNGQFTEADLQGKWHFITFGYTQCPDICPTTLMVLTQFANMLQAAGQANEADIIFYSVDPLRDTTSILSQYITYFNHQFIALKAGENDSYHAFEKSLGIKSNIEGSIEFPEQYKVSHNLAILLINPKVELQAVFLPQSNTIDAMHFTGEQLFKDYQEVKGFYQNINEISH